MTSLPLSIVILAAGKGTRMKSDIAKVLHEVFFAPMVQHVVTAVLPFKPNQTVIVVGHQSQAVTMALQTFPCEFVIQNQQLGTGHAVLSTRQTLKEENCTVMILCGDTPLIQTETLVQMYNAHVEGRTTLTLMTTILENPTNYGRIITSPEGKVIGIVEEKDASVSQLQLREVNAGIYCVDKTFLFSALEKVDTNNFQKEVYLTDIVKHAVAGGFKVEKFISPSPIEVLGVNSRVELAAAQLELQKRRNLELMLLGVTMYNPETIAVSPEAHICNDTLLEAGVQITGKSTVGQGSRICQGAILHNCMVGERSIIGPYSCLTNSTIAADSKLPPFSSGC